jgi:hypothetical protein
MTASTAPIGSANAEATDVGDVLRADVDRGAELLGLGERRIRVVDEDVG